VAKAASGLERVCQWQTPGPKPRSVSVGVAIASAICARLARRVPLGPPNKIPVLSRRVFYLVRQSSATIKPMQQKYMHMAVRAAQQAKASGGVAIGAVLVENATGKVVSAAGSNVGVTHDPTSHAEVNCIRQACKQLGADDLYGYTLYSTLEPCHMCLSAAAWARITKVFFGAYRKDVDPTLFDIKGDFSDEQEAARMNLREQDQMQVVGGVLEKECASLLDSYHEMFKHSKAAQTS